MLHFSEGWVAFACVHQKLRWRGEETPYFVLALQDEAVFLSTLPVRLFDAANKAVPSAVEITPGSEVRVRWRADHGVRWMTAVQIVRLSDDDQALFEPVAGEGVFSSSG